MKEFEITRHELIQLYQSLGSKVQLASGTKDNVDKYDGVVCFVVDARHYVQAAQELHPLERIFVYAK